MIIRTEEKLINNILLHQISIKNRKDFEVVFLDYGASIYSIAYPDRQGNMGKVLESCKDLNTFIHSGACYGKTIAPVAGRIENSTAIIDEKTYHFEPNEGVHVCHSASANMGNKIWKFEIKQNAQKVDLIFTALGKDGEAGFPGNISYKVIYTIYEDKKELTIHMYAKPDRPSLINMTNHLYINLSGGVEKIYNHELYLNASKVARMDQGLIIQEFVDVPHYLDYQEPTKLGKNILNPILLEHRSHGMDHPFLFNGVDKNKPCASIYDPTTKRKMTMYTSLPAVICYCDNYPDGKENQVGIIDDGNYGITFESVIPTNDISKILFDAEHPYSSVTKYKFN